MARTGRRRGPTQTPELILEAARSLFAERGYQGASVRAVAHRAGVDAALVHHHFGTKDRLFMAALELPVNPVEVIPALLADGPRDEFPERFVRFFVAAWRHPDTGPQLRAVLRSAFATDQGAAALRMLAADVVLARIAAAIGVSELRVTIALTHLLGLMAGATIIGFEPLASASDDELVALVTPAIARYLTPPD